jgi:hypothetical protein
MQNTGVNARTDRIKTKSLRKLQLNRLTCAIKEYEGTLERRLGESCKNTNSVDKETGTITWKNTACRFLVDAKSALNSQDIDTGWQCLHAAQREEILGYEPDELAERSIMLRHEAGKLTGWRKDIIYKLIDKPDAQVDSSISNRALFKAVQVRDEHYNNKYFKIALRRKNLFFLFVTILLIVGLIPLLSGFVGFPKPLNDWKMLLLVEIFGALGATFSVALTLTNRSVEAKIPDQILGSFVTWMRPAIGATAAVAAYVFSQAGLLAGIFKGDFQKIPLILSIAFIAGFSERLVINAIGKVSGDENKDSTKKQ